MIFCMQGEKSKMAISKKDLEYLEGVYRKYAPVKMPEPKTTSKNSSPIPMPEPRITSETLSSSVKMPEPKIPQSQEYQDAAITLSLYRRKI